jgi:endoglucanase
MKARAFIYSVLGTTAAANYIQSPASLVHGVRSADVKVRQAGSSPTGWPYGPFSTKGRDIVNSRGDVISWAGVNWPMSGM